MTKPDREVATSQRTRAPRVIFEENSGLTSVIPVDLIEETAKLAQRRLKARIAQGKRRSRVKRRL
ncbi:MAG: hypothetical protein JSW12_07250 [Deltaproteobacteria bacterium]|nr:MAG: hypothetical protein JSW12_07250 [Deltaproteobacteria bacterium]